jgi:hypothetical protein
MKFPACHEADRYFPFRGRYRIPTRIPAAAISKDANKGGDDNPGTERYTRPPRATSSPIHSNAEPSRLETSATAIIVNCTELKQISCAGSCSQSDIRERKTDRIAKRKNAEIHVPPSN